MSSNIPVKYAFKKMGIRKVLRFIPLFNKEGLGGITKIIIFLLFITFAFVPELYATTSLTYDYDANGNLISGDEKYFEYNDANQLVRVMHGDASGPILAEYFYDYTGQRIKKVENGVTTYYIGKHFEKQIGGTSPGVTSYYFANAERVAKKDPSGNLYFYHSDHLGGTNVITDSSGNLIERIKYYPFGEIREGGNEKYSFTGKEKDKLTDFYYFEARYYNPEFKHFTTSDIVEPNLYNPQDLNRYSYVRNNPLKLVDSNGRAPIGTNEWSAEFYEARTNDRKKYELMKKQHQLWVSFGGAEAAAEEAYNEVMIDAYNRIIKGVQAVKTLADYSVAALSVVPGGQLFGIGYTAVTTYIEVAPKYIFSKPTSEDIKKDLGIIAYRTASAAAASYAFSGTSSTLNKAVNNVAWEGITSAGERALFNSSKDSGLIFKGTLNSRGETFIDNTSGHLGIAGYGVQTSGYIKLYDLK